MDREFRSDVLSMPDFDSRCQFVFDWYSKAEVSKCVTVTRSRGFGKQAVFDALDWAIAYCQFPHQYPCHFSGIPTDRGFLDLIFLCDARKPSEVKLKSMVVS